MAQKPVKKTAAQPAAKPVTKPAAKKAAPAKKPAPKKAAAKPVMDDVVMAAPAHACECGAHCGCGSNCACHGGCKFGRFIKKLILVLIVFALGFAAAKMCCCHPNFRGPRVHFVNGCLDVTRVQCPRLMAQLPMIDADANGCVSKAEYRAFKKQMRHQPAPMPEVVETPAMPVDVAE